MRGNSKAFISRKLVAHKIAAGVFHSSIVNAYADCVLCVTSRPSSFKASVNRLAKKTLLSIKRILGSVGELTRAPPPISVAQCRGLPRSHSSKTAIHIHTTAIFPSPAVVRHRSVRILPLRESLYGRCLPSPVGSLSDKTFLQQCRDQPGPQPHRRQVRSDCGAPPRQSIGAWYEERFAACLGGLVLPLL